MTKAHELRKQVLDDIEAGNRELLELVAKAAGYSVRTDLTYEGVIVINDGVFWDPLTDDGDALRLAVKLKFNFAYKSQDTDNHRPIPSGVTVWLRHPSSYGLSHTTKLPAFVFEQHHDEDHCAATRRAIVRAAAAIGEQMK